MARIITINRRAGGRNAAIHGRNFEHTVDRSCRDAQGEVFSLVTIPSGARWVRSGGKTVTIPTASPFDRIGVVVGTGRLIAFDCKSTEHASFPANHDNVVRTHQIDHLSRLRDAGGIAGFLVECRRLGRYLWLDAGHLVPRPGKPIQWNDGRWVDLGPTTEHVQFRRLVMAYEHLERKAQDE